MSRRCFSVVFLRVLGGSGIVMFVLGLSLGILRWFCMVLSYSVVVPQGL